MLSVPIWPNRCLVKTTPYKLANGKKSDRMIPWEMGLFDFLNGDANVFWGSGIWGRQDCLGSENFKVPRILIWGLKFTVNEIIWCRKICCM